MGPMLPEEGKVIFAAVVLTFQELVPQLVPPSSMTARYVAGHCSKLPDTRVDGTAVQFVAVPDGEVVVVKLSLFVLFGAAKRFQRVLLAAGAAAATAERIVIAVQS